MATYRHVENLTDAREVSGAPESYQVDFKSDAHPEAWWELAKDIAAFANHVGGVILVGAAENPGGARLHGIDSARAAELAQAYEHAARDKCRPQPTVACATVPLDGEKVLLAVNVDPVPDQIVGAMFYAVNKKNDKGTSDAWRFYVRIGRHNVALTPDRLAMHMNTAVRRIVIRLEEIPADNALQILWRPGRHSPSRKAPQQLEARRHEVDVQGNVLRWPEHATDGSEYSVFVPLDDIEAVWRGPGDTWFVRVCGQFDKPRGSTVYISNPSNTDWWVK